MVKYIHCSSRVSEFSSHLQLISRGSEAFWPLWAPAFMYTYLIRTKINLLKKKVLITFPILIINIHVL